MEELKAVAMRWEHRRVLGVSSVSELALVSDKTLRKLPLGPRRKAQALRQAAANDKLFRRKHTSPSSTRKQAALQPIRPLPQGRAHLSVHSVLQPGESRKLELANLLRNVIVKAERDSQLLNPHGLEGDAVEAETCMLWQLANGRQFFDVRRAENDLVESLGPPDTAASPCEGRSRDDAEPIDIG
jgi:hypothetical protein